MDKHSPLDEYRISDRIELRKDEDGVPKWFIYSTREGWDIIGGDGEDDHGLSLYPEDFPLGSVLQLYTPKVTKFHE